MEKGRTKWKEVTALTCSLCGSKKLTFTTALLDVCAKGQRHRSMNGQTEDSTFKTAKE